MASIYLPVFRAKNASGVIVSGAGLWVYETGTTTPADIFTDDALTVSAPNPLTSDSAGYFPQFYIASSTRVDLQCRAIHDDVTSTPLWQALKIDSLGADDASTFLRDFGEDGRIKARGGGDIVNLEFGDPVGDNVGGRGRIGGWDGTEGVELDLDFTSVLLRHTALAAAFAFQTLADGENIAWDMAFGFNARVTLAGNRTVSAPTNPLDGLTCTLEITQDATGSRTLAWNSVFDWGSLGAPTLSTGAGKVDFAYGQYSSSTEKWHMSFRRAAA